MQRGKFRASQRPLRVKRVSYDPEYISGLNYKSASQLRKFISDRGKILSRRHTGLSAKQQRHDQTLDDRDVQVWIAQYVAHRG